LSYGPSTTYGHSRFLGLYRFQLNTLSPNYTRRAFRPPIGGEPEPSVRTLSSRQYFYAPWSSDSVRISTPAMTSLPAKLCRRQFHIKSRIPASITTFSTSGVNSVALLSGARSQTQNCFFLIR